MTDAREGILRALRMNSPGLGLSEASLRTAFAAALGQPRGLSRASLVVSGAAAMGLPPHISERLACAVEYWHQASLVLDDLPCMDDSPIRRGRSSLHVEHGEAVAILTALGLVNRAYGLVEEAYETEPLEIRSRARALVQSALGAAGIIEGQALDLAFEECAGEPREVLRIAWRKTGMLLWLSLCLPLVGSAYWSECRRDFRALGVHWSLAYQGLDDLTDASCSVSGRDDRSNRRPNLALSLGRSRALERIDRHLARADGSLARIVKSDPRLAYLGEWQSSNLVSRYKDLVAA